MQLIETTSAGKKEALLRYEAEVCALPAPVSGGAEDDGEEPRKPGKGAMKISSTLENEVRRD